MSKDNERFKNTVLFGTPATDSEMTAVMPVAFIAGMILLVLFLVFSPSKTADDAKKDVKKTDSVTVKK